MTEIAINGGDGLKKPHPALLDPKVREAIGHAIDRDTLVNRVESGFAQPRRPSALHRIPSGHLISATVR